MFLARAARLCSLSAMANQDGQNCSESSRGNRKRKYSLVACDLTLPEQPRRAVVARYLTRRPPHQTSLLIHHQLPQPEGDEADSSQQQQQQLVPYRPQSLQSHQPRLATLSPSSPPSPSALDMASRDASNLPDPNNVFKDPGRLSCTALVKYRQETPVPDFVPQELLNTDVTINRLVEFYNQIEHSNERKAFITWLFGSIDAQQQQFSLSCYWLLDELRKVTEKDKMKRIFGEGEEAISKRFPSFQKAADHGKSIRDRYTGCTTAILAHWGEPVLHLPEIQRVLTNPENCKTMQTYVNKNHDWEKAATQITRMVFSRCMRPASGQKVEIEIKPADLNNIMQTRNPWENAKDLNLNSAEVKAWRRTHGVHFYNDSDMFYVDGVTPNATISLPDEGVPPGSPRPAIARNRPVVPVPPTTRKTRSETKKDEQRGQNPAPPSTPGPPSRDVTPMPTPTPDSRPAPKPAPPTPGDPAPRPRTGSTASDASYRSGASSQASGKAVFHETSLQGRACANCLESTDNQLILQIMYGGSEGYDEEEQRKFLEGRRDRKHGGHWKA